MMLSQLQWLHEMILIIDIVYVQEDVVGVLSGDSNDASHSEVTLLLGTTQSQIPTALLNEL
jgi:hypothetical protein